MYLLKKIFVQSPGHYIAALLLDAAVGIFRFTTLPQGIGARFLWREVLSVSGSVTLLIGGLLTVAYFGAFDLFGYVFSPGRFGENRKYKDYAQYSQKMAERRASGGYSFVPYYVVGTVVALSSLLFM